MANTPQSAPLTPLLSMREITKMSSKGQVVIPREIREEMGLMPGQTLYLTGVSSTELRLSTLSAIERTAGSLNGLWGDDPMEWLKRDRAESDRF